jgi:hypothetical protein
VPVTATFPISNAATCSSGGVRGVFNAGAIGGGPFSFAAHLTGN